MNSQPPSGDALREAFDNEYDNNHMSEGAYRRLLALAATPVPPEYYAPPRSRQPEYTPAPLDVERLARAIKQEYGHPESAVADLDWGIEIYGSPNELAAAIARAYAEQDA